MLIIFYHFEALAHNFKPTVLTTAGYVEKPALTFLNHQSYDCYKIIISLFFTGCLAFTNRNEDLMSF